MSRALLNGAAAVALVAAAGAAFVGVLALRGAGADGDVDFGGCRGPLASRSITKTPTASRSIR